MSTCDIGEERVSEFVQKRHYEIHRVEDISSVGDKLEEYVDAQEPCEQEDIVLFGHRLFVEYDDFYMKQSAWGWIVLADTIRTCIMV